MEDPMKIGIIICHRYHTCAGGKCSESATTGVHSHYKDRPWSSSAHDVTDVRGNVEYAQPRCKERRAGHSFITDSCGLSPCPTSFSRKFVRSKYG
jgi:hypothetical protein